MISQVENQYQCFNQGNTNDSSAEHRILLSQTVEIVNLSSAIFSAVSQHPPQIIFVFFDNIDRCLFENFVEFYDLEGTDCEGTHTATLHKSYFPTKKDKVVRCISSGWSKSPSLP